MAALPSTSLASEREIYSLVDQAIKADNAGDQQTAIVLLRQAIGSVSREFGEQSEEMSFVLTGYGKVLFRARRYEEAAEVQTRAIDILRSRTGDGTLDLAEAKHNLGISFLGLGRNKSALDLFLEVAPVYRDKKGTNDPQYIHLLTDMLAATKGAATIEYTIEMGETIIQKAVKVHGAQSLEVMRVRAIMADAFYGAERNSEAADQFIAIARFMEREIGLSDPRTLEIVGSAAAALLRTAGREAEALRYANKAEKAYTLLLAKYGDAQGDRLQVSRDQLDYIGTAVIRVGALWIHDRDSSQTLAEVAEQVQRAYLGKTSEAVADAAAKRATRDRPDLKSLLDSRDRFEIEYAQIEAKLQLALAGETNGGVGAVSIAALNSQLTASDEKVAEANRRIDRLAPELNELMRNEPLGLEQAQEMLRRDEAVLMTMPGILGYHVVLLTSDDARWHRTQLSREEINALTSRLAWDLGIEVHEPRAKLLEWEREGEGAYPYDFETAHALYRELVEPFEEQLVGKKGLYTLLSGPTSRIPLGVLVEAVPEGPNGSPETLRAAPWLADRFAVLRVPSLRSIKFLRQSSAGPTSGNSERRPFLGIGDPVLGAAGGQRGSNPSDRKRRTRGATRSFDSSVGRLGSGKLADPTALRSLASLPGTERELVAMWNEFGQPADALFLEEQATETMIRDLDLSADVIALATHGLMAGEMYGLAEPGLVLTPPDRANAEDDGYLSISDIAALDVDADWVILSACNTASPDGSEEGQLGMSGLARSFLFAGARGLLVSHWPVRDDVAPELTIAAVRAMKKDPSLSKAEALQRAMQQVRSDTRADSERDTWAHPGAWAPFSYIGTM